MIDCIPLSDLPIGVKAKVLNFETDKIPIKLIEMGVLPNTYLTIISKAPFHGPFLIEYGEDLSRLSLREEEAKGILITQKL